jgi:hypothetical protein
MSELSWRTLAPACLRADLSMPALHLRCIALGGIATLPELTAHFVSGGSLSNTEHDVAVHAINERFLELHDPERLPYYAARGAR